MTIKIFRYIPPWHGILLSILFLIAAITFIVSGSFFANRTYYSCPSDSVKFNNCCLNINNNTCANYDVNITTCPINTTISNCCMNLEHICVDNTVESRATEITFFMCGIIMLISALAIPVMNCCRIHKQ